MKAMSDELPRAQFSPGQLVLHKNFSYRGVVVDVDATFSGSAEWYNQVARSRPPKNAPWYHVLVHGSHQVTYAAQTSLEEDDSGEQVFHPLVAHLFSSFDGGLYVRNDEPWPGS